METYGDKCLAFSRPGDQSEFEGSEFVQCLKWVGWSRLQKLELAGVQ
jgi:hypothetical protein